MFSYAISRVPVYTAISIFKVVFSTLQSSSYCQLAHSCLLREYEGLLLRIDILSFFVTNWYIFEVICWVFSTFGVVRNSFPVE